MNRTWSERKALRREARKVLVAQPRTPSGSIIKGFELAYDTKRAQYAALLESCGRPPGTRDEQGDKAARLAWLGAGRKVPARWAL